ncbi:FapA family protein [Candidatus Gracilibacteria bacterium]|nr:FapA family protein [Candidatus Gracilibacteria bacterium]
MLRYLAGTGILLSLLFPHTVGAYTVIEGNENIRIEKPINDNIYVAGGNIDTQSEITGDGFFAGGNIKVGGKISNSVYIAGGDIETSGIIGDDLFVAGGSIRVKNTTEGDIRITGGKVSIENSASGDINLAAGDMSISKGVVIGGDLAMAGGKGIMNGHVQGKANILIGEIDFDGKIDGDVYIDIYDNSKIRIGPNAQILGKLTYKSKQAIPELEKISTQGAVYLGGSSFSDHEEYDEHIYGIVAWSLVYKFLFLLIVGSIILGLFGKNLGQIATTLKSHIGKSFIFGILYFILTPIIAILFFITVIGIPVGILTVALYGFTFLFAKLIVLLLGTSLINTTWSQTFSTPWKKWGVFVLLAFILSLVNGIDLIFAIFAVGAIVLHMIHTFEKRHI